jgi:hypothetical protein
MGDRRLKKFVGHLLVLKTCAHGGSIPISENAT